MRSLFDISEALSTGTSVRTASDCSLEREVLDIIVQRWRDTAAAEKLMRKLMRKHGYASDILITDKLRSYGAAKAKLRLSARHEQGLRKNNRAENSHLP